MHKKKIKTIMIGIFSFVFAMISTCVLYFCFSQFLCYPVHASSESIINDAYEIPVDAESIYVETFSPRYSYIKTISIHIRCEDNFNGKEIIGRLEDARGRVISESTYRLSEDDSYNYIEFEIEEWVKQDAQYNFTVLFPECNGIALLYGPEKIGPNEHISLWENGQYTDNCMYMRYIYGDYSKKLLILWFLAFYIVEFQFVEIIAKYVKK